MTKMTNAENLVKKSVITMIKPIQAFMRIEASSGVLLLLTTAFALYFANSMFAETYFSFVKTPFTVTVGGFTLEKNLLLLVNDGLMAIFFFLVGLEIKRELLIGELSSVRKASFSFFAAIGGMLIPALFYVFGNIGTPAISGWGVPMATDIAFALGVLTLFGKRVPVALKIFLLALAIVDDLGAILIIALFYTSKVSVGFLALAAFVLLVLFLLNYSGFRNIGIGMLLGFVVWFCFLKSGVHATIAGVLLAFLTPAYAENDTGSEEGFLLDHLIHALHPWVAFMIMPIFAFFNAGVSLAGFNLGSFFESPIALGIILGLVVGKPLGIFVFTYLATKLGFTEKPENVSWTKITSVGFLAGIGFTMSLFIAGLGFDDPAMHATAKVSILMASAIAMALGSLILFLALKEKER